MFRIFVYISVCCLWVIEAIPIDNGVESVPEIECGTGSILVTFNTKNNFEGHVYVKGLYEGTDDACRTTGNSSQAVASINIPFDKCNVERKRSANPRGIFVQTTVVISFHPHFITKVDRAFTLQCFYMEADKTVSQELEVSAITTQLATTTVPMPICRYDIVDALDNGNAVKYALIGQAVFHKWTCDTETVDTFCMRVYGCYVLDPRGANRLNLLDDQGCAIDKYLMGNLEYPTDLMAVKEVHVFKYADRPALFFQCQIALAVKEPNSNCATQTQPKCGEPLGAGDGNPEAKRRKRRSSPDELAVVDVDVHLETLDISEQQNEIDPIDHSSYPDYRTVAIYRDQNKVCLSKVHFAWIMLVFVIIVASIVTVAAVLYERRK